MAKAMNAQYYYQDKDHNECGIDEAAGLVIDFGYKDGVDARGNAVFKVEDTRTISLSEIKDPAAGCLAIFGLKKKCQNDFAGTSSTEERVAAFDVLAKRFREIGEWNAGKAPMTTRELEAVNRARADEGLEPVTMARISEVAESKPEAIKALLANAAVQQHLAQLEAEAAKARAKQAAAAVKAGEADSGSLDI